MLAHAPKAMQKTIIDRELTKATPEDPWYGSSAESMLQLLDDIREQGISPSSGAVVPGFSGIAAAIIDHEGASAGALTIIGDTRHFDGRPGGKLATTLIEVARDISDSIGGRPSKRSRRAGTRQPSGAISDID